MAEISGELDEDQEEEDPREFGEFDFGEHVIRLAEPSSGQMLIVLGLVDLLDEPDKQVQIEMVNNFGVVIRSLFTRARDRQIVMRSLAAGTVQVESFFELALDVIKYWAPEQLEGNRPKAPKNGPVIAKRAARASRRGR